MTATEKFPTGAMVAARLDRTEIDALAAGFRGELVLPEDRGYDAARRVWNGMIDKRPALIARCTGTADVVAAVNFARERGLPVAVRGAGHNVAGNAVNDDGIVIDLSPMKGIHVDPTRHVARAQAGATWGDLNHETQIHGLVTPGGEVSTTGIAGYTLSGGIGQLHRKWGLACDNLLAVEIVTADGTVRRASATEHHDLFWGVRGGGGNFGVVTWFEYQLHPLGPEVYSSATIYAGDDALAVLRAWRGYTDAAPDDVTAELIVWCMPPLPDVPEELIGAMIVFVGGLYAGPVEVGEQVLSPLRELGAPLIDLSGAAPYTLTQSFLDDLFAPGQLNYWKSLSLDRLDDDALDAIVAIAHQRPAPTCAIALRHLGGAVSQLPDDATAYGNRRAQFNLSLDSIWQDPNESGRIVAWTRAAWASLRERFGGGVYLNFAGLGEENDLLARAGYGPNVDRLREVKRHYDPSNLFRGNINVAP